MLKTIRLASVAVAAVLATAGAQAAVCTGASGTVTLFCGERGGVNGEVVVEGAPVDARDAFKLKAGTTTTETFTGATAGALSPIPLAFGTMSGRTTTSDPLGGTVVTSHIGVVASGSGTTDGVGRTGTSGANPELFVDGGVGGFVVAFTDAVSAFGFYGIDIGDFGGSVLIELFGPSAKFDDDGDLVPSDPSDPSSTATPLQSFGIKPGENITDASLLFWGFVDTAAKYKYAKFSFIGADGNPNKDDGMGFDDLTIGAAVPPNPTPEPAGLALLGAAFAAAALARRRGRRAD